MHLNKKRENLTNHPHEKREGKNQRLKPEDEKGAMRERQTERNGGTDRSGQ